MTRRKEMTESSDINRGKRVNPWRVAAWSTPVIALLVPLIAMQFTDEVNWTVGDFVIMGMLMLCVGVAYELTLKLTRNTTYRAAAGMALATSFVLIWVNGAVGIIGDGPINVLYGAVILVGFIGAIVAKFKPAGMSRVLFAMAVTQMLIPVIALLAKAPFAPGVIQVFFLNGVFAMFFVGSGLLFRDSSRGQPSAAA
jgi:hypothetical protein